VWASGHKESDVRYVKGYPLSFKRGRKKKKRLEKTEKSLCGNKSHVKETLLGFRKKKRKGQSFLRSIERNKS